MYAICSHISNYSYNQGHMIERRSKRHGLIGPNYLKTNKQILIRQNKVKILPYRNSI